MAGAETAGTVVVTAVNFNLGHIYVSMALIFNRKKLINTLIAYLNFNIGLKILIKIRE